MGKYTAGEPDGCYVLLGAFQLPLESHYIWSQYGDCVAVGVQDGGVGAVVNDTRN